MNNTKKQIIPDFIPYPQIKLCSNNLGVKYLFDINGYYPIIIGQGNIPKVWLFVEINNEIVSLLKDNVPQIAQIKIHKEKKYLKIKVYDFATQEWLPILNINFSNPNLPNIDCLDLRPFGILCYGNKELLHIGNNKLKDNSISGAEVFIKAE